MKTEWENLIVDDAGYLIGTSAHIRCASEDLAGCLEDRTLYEFFDVAPLTANEKREHIASTLRRVAANILRIAEEMDAPRIDQSDSPLVGYDADHSIL